MSKNYKITLESPLEAIKPVPNVFYRPVYRSEAQFDEAFVGSKYSHPSHITHNSRLIVILKFEEQ